MKAVLLMISCFFLFSCDRREEEVVQREVISPEDLREERREELYFEKDFMDEDNIPAGNEELTPNPVEREKVFQ